MPRHPPSILYALPHSVHWQLWACGFSFADEKPEKPDLPERLSENIKDPYGACSILRSDLRPHNLLLSANPDYYLPWVRIKC